MNYAHVFMLDAYSGRSRMPLSLKRWATWGNRADGLAYSLKLDSLLTTHYSPNPPPPPQSISPPKQPTHKQKHHTIECLFNQSLSDVSKSNNR